MEAIRVAARRDSLDGVTSNAAVSETSASYVFLSVCVCGGLPKSCTCICAKDQAYAVSKLNLQYFIVNAN